MVKKIVKVLVILLLAVLFVNGETEVKKYAVITNPAGAAVRSAVEPGSNRVGPRNIPRGQRLEVLGEGKLWVYVRTSHGDGYIQITDCEIREGGLRSSPVGTIILLLVLLGAAGSGAYFFYTKKGVLEHKDEQVQV
jgi:hypothetical protein